MGKLKIIPNNVTLHCGHDYGPTIAPTMGEQKDSNRFLMAKNIAEFNKLLTFVGRWNIYRNWVMKNEDEGLKRVFSAFKFSINGLKFCYKNEKAFKQEVLLSLILVPLSFILGDNKVEVVVLLGSIFFILVTEILNSSIEAVVDRIGSEYNYLSGVAKDMGSAGVFLSLVFGVFTWIWILI
jgi:diacylglycerol kinase (ATP)